MAKLVERRDGGVWSILWIGYREIQMNIDSDRGTSDDAGRTGMIASREVAQRQTDDEWVVGTSVGRAQ